MFMKFAPFQWSNLFALFSKSELMLLQDLRLKEMLGIIKALIVVGTQTLISPKAYFFLQQGGELSQG